MKAKQNTFLSTLKNSCELFVVIILAAYIFTSIVYKDKLIKVLGFDFAIVQTSSMFPTIKTYEFIVVSNNLNFSKDDIAIFFDDAGKNMIVHRIINIQEENGELHYYTKGDNNQFRDAGSRVITDFYAKYSFKVPFLGLLITFLKSPLGVCALFLNFSTVISIMLLWSFEKFTYSKKLKS